MKKSLRSPKRLLLEHLQPLVDALRTPSRRHWQGGRGCRALRSAQGVEQRVDLPERLKDLTSSLSSLEVFRSLYMSL